MEIKGVLPVVQLPYNDDFTIDFDTFKREIDWLFDEGVDGIVLAMVTEVLRLTDIERDEVVAKAVQFTAARGPAIASVGAESIQQAIRHARAAETNGATALMAIPPSLTSCNSQEITRYYTEILEATTLPLIVQDASGYVGNSIPVATQAALYNDNPGRIMFKPEAQPFGANLSAIRDATDGKAPIFEGTGGIALVNSYQRGIVGTMPGADLPWALVAIWKALENGDIDRACKIHGTLGILISMQHNLDAFLVIEKTLLVKQGVFKNTLVRGPLGYKLDRETEEEVYRLFDLLKEACD